MPQGEKERQKEPETKSGPENKAAGIEGSGTADMMARVVRRRIVWPKVYRIIRSIYPPIDLFEDIADPRDWEALVSVEEKTNPRIRDEVGDLGKVPAARRVSGPGASYLMAPFVHCSPMRPGRFSDGHYGMLYAGDSQEVALAETIHHHSLFMAATDEAAGWTSDFRLLIGAIDAELHDVNAVTEALHPEDYGPSQALGRALRAAGSEGVTWASLRLDQGLDHSLDHSSDRGLDYGRKRDSQTSGQTGGQFGDAGDDQSGSEDKGKGRGRGQCIGLFWPDVMTAPRQGAHFSYHWDGERVDYIKRHDTGETFAVSGR